MCGIGAIVAGTTIDLSSILPSSSSPPQPLNRHVDHVPISLDDLKSSLTRRGPDSLGTKTLTLINPATPQDDRETSDPPVVHFLGATLQLRGLSPVAQPLSDSSGNVLVFNGEIFGGVDVGSESNDGEALLRALGRCCSCAASGHDALCSGEGKSVPEVLSVVKGPWAVIYWQECSRTVWFGRDAFGRRSLLVHWPSEVDSRFLLSSVSPFPSAEGSSGLDPNNNGNLNFWEELMCGIYSLTLKLSGSVTGEVRKHEWCNAKLVDLIKWERDFVEPMPQDLQSAGLEKMSLSSPADHVLSALRKSVMLRVSSHRNFQGVRFGNRKEDFVPVAVLFSGGLDSMILATLLDECLDPCYGIDLLNVSFDRGSAPDRISAKAGLQELKRIAPSRRWNLVEIDSDLANLSSELLHVMSLIHPASTYMDLNIGVALWLAASGDGWVCQGTINDQDESYQRIRYKSEAKIVLVGAGADEQCAGYGRHRTKYRNASWIGLHEEMKLDMQRIWKRNMGRDDRCIADNGKEARFPFLDEDVIETLLRIPLWKIADLDQPIGVGEKKILREVAILLGLHEAAVMPKRAIQFGSRIARESNRKNFGSNRAANLASAGSATINMS